jgi:putative hydrolase of the HAD superfamily
MKYKIIGFDADDTLWVNEPFYRETELKFTEILKDYLPEQELINKLFKTEMDNLELYGYGTKGFVLSLIETAIRISKNKVSASKIEDIINLGKDLIKRPNELLDDVKNVLIKLSQTHTLVVATKGDLLDQERKLKKSGLSYLFHHIEVMSDKKEENYLKLLQNLGITPEEFLMVGNSLKSDILPVLNIGGNAIHIPFHTTWVHEEVKDGELKSLKFTTVNSISEILELIK